MNLWIFIAINSVKLWPFFCGVWVFSRVLYAWLIWKSIEKSTTVKVATILYYWKKLELKHVIMCMNTSIDEDQLQIF